MFLHGAFLADTFLLYFQIASAAQLVPLDPTAHLLGEQDHFDTQAALSWISVQA